MMELYPVMIRLAGRRVTVIGAGEVALRKVGDLLSCGAQVRVIAPAMRADFDGLARDYGPSLALIMREYRAGDLEGSLLAVSATNDAAVNRAVYAEAMQRGILINAVDDPPNCSFFIPSSYRAGDLTVAVSTGGASPPLAARLRRELQKYVPEDIATLLEALKQARHILHSTESFAHLDADARGRLLKAIVHDDALLKELRDAFEQGQLESFLQGGL